MLLRRLSRGDAVLCGSATAQVSGHLCDDEHPGRATRYGRRLLKTLHMSAASAEAMDMSAARCRSDRRRTSLNIDGAGAGCKAGLSQASEQESRELTSASSCARWERVSTPSRDCESRQHRKVSVEAPYHRTDSHWLRELDRLTHSGPRL